MLTTPHVLLLIVVRCVVVYGVMLLAFRLMGKREVGQMTPFDLVLLLLVANAVQNAMVGPDNSLLGGVVAAATLFLLDQQISRMILGHPRFRRAVMGNPALLVRDGQIITDNLRKEGISMDSLKAALREHGVASVGDVSMAVLEVDGSISVLKYDDLTPGHHPHRKIRFLRQPGA
jgi:uncharacterized membrane protein YcaP (DUF421 family)